MHKLFTSLYLLIAISLYSGLLDAQSPTPSNQAETTQQELTLRQKYQEELNNTTLRAYEGDRDAQFRAGVLFTNDQFEKPDYEKAVYWYTQAARQGHVVAQYNLGHQYLNGVGVLQSTETAMQWWLKAAQLGHPLSQFNVGRAYYLGIGLPADLKKSKYWFEQAAANKEPKSIEILAELNWDSLEPTKTITANDNTSTLAKADTPIEPAIDPTKVTALSVPATQQIKTTTDETTSSVNKKAVKPLEKVTTSNTDNNAITLYTSPFKRSVLISMVYDPANLETIKHSKNWINVRHKKGFPVWVHKDFVSIDGSQATLTGNSVNARAVPLIIEGSIVGKLNKGDKVTVINKTDKWVRITSPTSFTAWVKKEEFGEKTSLNVTATQKTIPVTTTQTALTANSNAWLFQQSANNFTLQLASFDNQEDANNFASNSGLAADSNLHKFTSASNSIAWTYFLYGSFTDKIKAKIAQQSINTKDAWVRNIGKIQQNRCIAWKKQLPTPKELNMYCTPSNN